MVLADQTKRRGRKNVADLSNRGFGDWHVSNVHRIKRYHRNDTRAEWLALCACGRTGWVLASAHRLPRTARVQAAAANNKTRFHLPDGAEQVARDAEMAKSLTDFSLHSVGWLYGHDAAQVDDA